MSFKSIAFPIGWAILIFGLCHLPGKDLPDIPIFGVDKLVHFGLFFILSYSIYKVPSLSDKKTLIVLLSCVILPFFYGILLELYQGAFVEDRTADPFDALANGLGAYAGFYINLIRKRRN